MSISISAALTSSSANIVLRTSSKSYNDKNEQLINYTTNVSWNIFTIKIYKIFSINFQPISFIAEPQKLNSTKFYNKIIFLRMEFPNLW